MMDGERREGGGGEWEGLGMHAGIRVGVDEVVNVLGEVMGRRVRLCG